MKFHELNADAKKNRKRVGRGIAAGGGKTAGRGTKGQKARTGKKLRPGFEGGQLPLLQRVPKKRGFRSLRAPIQVVYTSQLNNLTVKEVTNTTLYEAEMIATPYYGVKIILKGEMTKPLTVKTQAASVGAVEAIKAAGGSFEKVAVAHQPKKSTNTK